MFAALLAAFKTLLFRYSGQEDIVIGSPIANRNRSVDKWYDTNYDSYKDILAPIEQLFNTNPTPPTPNPANPASGATPALTTADKASARRAARATANWKLMLSTTVKDEATGTESLVVPNLSEPMASAIAESGPAYALSTVMNSIQGFINNRKGTHHYMNQSIDFSVAVLNVTFIAAMTNFHLRTNPMDETQGAFNASITAYNFTPPRKNTPEYQRIIDENQQVLFEIINQESASNRTKTSSSLYTAGRQETYEDVRSTLANLDMYFSWVADTNDTTNNIPDIIQDCRTIFDLISNDLMKNWFSTWSNTAEWLAHAFLQDIQNLIRARAAFANDDANVAKLSADEEIPLTGLMIYKGQRDALIARYTELMNQTTLAAYASQPITWNHFKHVPRIPRKHSSTQNDSDFPARRRNGNPPASNATHQTGSNSDKGFIVITGQNPAACQLSGQKHLCFNWATVGRSCPNGRSCRFAHVTYPYMNGIEADRTTMEAWVTSTPGVTWAPGVSPRSSPRQNRVQRRPNSGAPPSNDRRNISGLPPVIENSTPPSGNNSNGANTQH